MRGLRRRRAVRVGHLRGGGCQGGLQRCDGVCRDVASDLVHCGGCGRACPTPVGARVRCEAGACVFVCVAADGAPEQVDPTSNPRHCGACGNRCAEDCFESACVPADCRSVLRAVVDCLVESPACPGVGPEDAERIMREGRAICESGGLMGLVRRAVADADCPAIVDLVGDATCFP
ncbi:MAG: hypothetical protein R3F43_27910 [bacterium]